MVVLAGSIGLLINGILMRRTSFAGVVVSLTHVVPATVSRTILS